MADNKPQVLILGGLGFVGRNLVLYLVEKDLCKFIRVVDKLTFGMAHLGERHQKAMENSVVEFIQGNLSIPGKIYVEIKFELKITYEIILRKFIPMEA